MSGTRERADAPTTRTREPGYPVCIPDETGHCGVCGDEGLVARVLEVLEGEPTARVRLEERGREGEETEVALDLLDGVAAGDRIVVHMGFGIAVVRDREGGGQPAGADAGRRGEVLRADPAPATEGSGSE